ncbi:Hypothetical_protein [Hexamita inflata]|uniref:Hypothetical_protein n=1 Tax=Hexamita inflata TaxID=28002 RepID=A0AA86RA45_9EUKA|nr:Hypothetical protein HINF_LOCUS32030 [Hexamita inflata]CAI9964430.1 Hypothetical protein HINF_LOCUS52075 [Hexamita inflata]
MKNLTNFPNLNFFKNSSFALLDSTRCCLKNHKTNIVLLLQTQSSEIIKVVVAKAYKIQYFRRCQNGSICATQMQAAGRGYRYFIRIQQFQDHTQTSTKYSMKDTKAKIYQKIVFKHNLIACIQF